MTETDRMTKRTTFGTEKKVYGTETMKRLRGWFTAEIARVLPLPRALYWT